MFETESLWLRRLFDEFSTNNLRPVIEKHLDQLPNWISYPDYDRSEWLNKFLEQFWPILSKYVENFLKNDFEVELEKQISGLSFDRVDLGDFPPRLGGIKVYTENVRPDEILLDLEIFYGGDLQIKLNYHHLKGGIKSLYFHGQLRLVLKSLVSKLPFVGAVEIFFLRPPTIDFDLTEMANLIDLPGLRQILSFTLDRLMKNLLVLPNRLTIDLLDQIEIHRWKSTQIDGILRFDRFQAAHLPRRSSGLFSRSKEKNGLSMKIQLAARKFRTERKSRRNPIWNEVFELPMENVDRSSSMEISLFDADDLIGTVNIPIETLRKQSNGLERWYKLSAKTNLSIQFRSHWFDLSTNFDDLKETQRLNEGEALSSALLCVFLDRAEQLQSTDTGRSVDPSPICRLEIEQFREKTSTMKNSRNPIWKKTFLFLLVHPIESILHLYLDDANEKSSPTIGSIHLPMEKLFSQTNWTIDTIYPLEKNAGQIAMKLEIRALKINRNLQLSAT